jgi:ubiquitin carboxyl-terminal hydrolase 5/13
MSKVATALLGDRYVTPLPDTPVMTAVSTEEAPPALQLEKYSVAPRMFKHVVSRGHRDFSSGRQQDASEYFQYLLDQLDRAERTALTSRLGAAEGALSTPSVFRFELEERYQCAVTNQVRYICGPQTAQNVLEVRIPLDKALNGAEVEAAHVERKRKLEQMAKSDNDDTNSGGAQEAGAEETPKLVVPFSACLDTHFAEDTVELRNPSLAEGAQSPLTPAAKSVRFGNFPRYLMVKLGRYYVDANWTMKKIDAEVPVPEHIDLTHLRALGGPLPGEEEMPATAAASGAAPRGEASSATADEGIVAQLMSMGFSENGSKRAALATHNADAEVAMSWVFEHMEDPDFNDPVVPVAVGGGSTHPTAEAGTPDPEALAMLLSFGYNDKQCSAALKAADNNVERYVSATV